VSPQYLFRNPHCARADPRDYPTGLVDPAEEFFRHSLIQLCQCFPLPKVLLKSLSLNFMVLLFSQQAFFGKLLGIRLNLQKSL
jgi:hypothetical protein